MVLLARMQPPDTSPSGHDPGLEIPQPDAELLTRFVAGDREAAGRLAEAYWPRMRRWAWLELRDAQLAEDACQEALIRMIRFCARYDVHRPFAAWLRTLVRNAARDQRPVLGRVVEIVRQVLPLERATDLKRAGDRVDAALESLSPRQRHLVDLCLRQGLPVVEAAELLEIAPSTARVHLHNARKRLADLLGAELHHLVREA